MKAGINEFLLLRNLVFAPISEEFVFRAYMISILFLVDKARSTTSIDSNIDSASRVTSVALIVPCFFGLAHLHHCWEKIRTGTPIANALLGTLVQAAYTSIFGFIAALLFMRTGSKSLQNILHLLQLPDRLLAKFAHLYVCSSDVSAYAVFNIHYPLKSSTFFARSILTYMHGAVVSVSLFHIPNTDIVAPITSHIYCNFMGLPDVGFMVSAEDKSSQARTELSFLYQYRYFLFALHVLGLVLFAYLLYPLTEGFERYSLYRQ
jgi:hypothetical protein